MIEQFHWTPIICQLSRGICWLVPRVCATVCLHSDI